MCVCVCVCVVCAVEVFFSRSLGFISIFGEGKGEVSLGAFFFSFFFRAALFRLRPKIAAHGSASFFLFNIIVVVVVAFFVC